jgi:uncharacterized protein YaaN involved in tellurite resistance
MSPDEQNLMPQKEEAKEAPQTESISDMVEKAQTDAEVASAISQAQTAQNRLLPVPVLEALAKKLSDTFTTTPEMLAKADEIAQAFNFDDTNAVLTFGSAPQERYKENLKQLLEGIKIGDVGQAGNITVELAEGIDLMQLDKMKQEATPDTWQYKLARFPIIGKGFSAIYVFAKRRELLIDMINKIESKARGQMRGIIEQNTKLDKMLRDVENNYNELAMYILSGEKILELGKTRYEELRKKAEESNNAIDISKVNLFYEQLIAFDTRLIRMKTAYVRAPVTSQKVLLTQQAGRIELQNLMDSLLFDLPNLLEAVNQVAALARLQAAQEGREKRRQAAEKLAKLGDETMAEVHKKAKAAQGDALEQIKSLEASAQSVINIIRTGRELDEKNKQVRREAEQLLIQIQDNFNKELKEVTKPASGL